MLVINGNKTLQIPNKKSIPNGQNTFIARSDKTGVAIERATGVATLKFIIFFVFYKYNHSLHLHVKELKLAYNCAYHIHMT